MVAPDQNPRPISRRNLTKGAAWAAPAMVVATAAPAVAASPQLGVQGWADFTLTCPTGAVRVQVNSPSNYPDYGFWAEGVQDTTVISDASFTLYLPADIFPGTTVWNMTGTGWSLFKRNDTLPQKSGFKAWTSTYSGAWQFRSEDGVKLATSVLIQQGVERIGECPASIQAYARRAMTIDGKPYVVEIGPVTISR